MAAGALSSDDQPEISVGSRSTPPSVPSSKAAVAPPKFTQAHDDLELNNMATNGEPPKQSLPIEDDIMQLARLGEVGAMQKLFDSKKFTAKYQDEEGITPLHWAAINNQYAMCKFLLDAGADVNAKGGDSVATPAMWAAQRCHYYIVNLLLQRGADPLLTDVQGYNILHLATIDGNAFLVVLLLHSGIPVDVTDPQGHTGLMWAAYKGFPACVDLFLRWGANVNAADEGGLTPLHWALVKGSLQCVQKIVEYGADRTATTRDGKTPTSVAREMRTVRVWQKALSECGYDPNGNLKTLPMGLTALVRNKSILSKFFFLWPFWTILVAIWIVSHFSIYLSVPLVLVVLFGFQWMAQQIANNAPTEFRVLQKTPYLAGVFAGTLFWVGVRYLTHVLPVTWSAHPLLNLFFILLYSLTTYFYVYSMIEDPGFVPKLGSRNQQREVISELFENWNFDEDNFCIPCMVRKPLRSKHCRRCGRCVAKHDHHCPWIHNCVGVNNLRHFVSYILSLELGIILFVQLVFFYVDMLPPADAQCRIVNSTVCDILSRDTFTLVLTFWAALQLIWVSMLCAVQLVQISRNQTTMENMRGHSIDQAHPATRAFTTALTAGTTSLAAAGLSADGHGPDPVVAGHNHAHHKGGFFQQWKRLLGLDTFLATAQAGFGEGGRSTRRRNPFSRGIVTNCRDFWCDPAPIFGKREAGSAMLGGEVVNYYRMYETPLRMRGSGGTGGSGYMSVANEDPEEV